MAKERFTQIQQMRAQLAQDLADVRAEDTELVARLDVLKHTHDNLIKNNKSQTKLAQKQESELQSIAEKTAQIKEQIAEKQSVQDMMRSFLAGYSEYDQSLDTTLLGLSVGDAEQLQQEMMGDGEEF